MDLFINITAYTYVHIFIHVLKNTSIHKPGINAVRFGACLSGTTELMKSMDFPKILSANFTTCSYVYMKKRITILFFDGDCDNDNINDNNNHNNDNKHNNDENMSMYIHIHLVNGRFLNETAKED